MCTAYVYCYVFFFQQEELEILFPNIKINERSLKLAQGEIDLFILYACQTILYYQKELSKLEVNVLIHLFIMIYIPIYICA